MTHTHPQTHSAISNATPQTAGAPSLAPGTSPPLSSFQPPSGPQCQQSNNIPDQSAPSSSPSATQQQPPRVAIGGPRSTSLPYRQQMGLSQSKPAPPLPAPEGSSSSSGSPSTATKGLNAAVAGGIKLKRAFARRRKNSEDVSVAFSPKGKEQQQAAKLRMGVSSSSLATDKVPRPQLSPPFPITTVQRSTPPRIESTKQPHPSMPMPLVLNQSLVLSPTQQSPQPPTPPKKDSTPSSPLQSDRSEVLYAGSRNSVMPISPGISSAVTYISMMDQPHVKSPEAEKENFKTVEKRDTKENWRKSDSTNSHHTIRPGGGSGTPSRSSRPVSWAESFQSAHTVVQTSNRRLSALIGDADFGMPEEDDDDTSSSSHAPESSPPSSVHSTSRRSMSLNLGTSTTALQQLPIPATDMKYPSHSISEGLPPFSVTLPPRAPPLSPSVSQPQISLANNGLRGRFAAWTAASANPPTSPPPVLPPSHERNPSAASHQTQASAVPSSFRQTAISMSAGVGPAAAGLAKRAVEKMGRKWAQGMGISSSSSGSGGWSTSSSSMNDASHMGDALVRTASNTSMSGLSSFLHPSPGRGAHKRTPNAASISSNSMGSGSDSDFFANPTGPLLGTRLRGALRSKGGTQIIAGVVFGRDLAAGARETGIKVGKAPHAEGKKKKEGLVGEVEERALAAVAVRCAQHLLLWGVQEEGLFRVNGRPAHVSKLRSEFDSGADYDMTECSPGDLDPHAVASVFKAYLRELPEPILTKKLQPLFDAAINKETTAHAADPASAPARLGARGMQGLPSGPKSGFSGGLRKPPSLSTLAMPSFADIPPASKALVEAIRVLIKQLPVENHDLMLTIVDLVKATASHSKETKMPLSNLMLVLHPTLKLTPSLLKVLCETEGIWRDGPLVADAEKEEASAIIDIRRQTVTREREKERDDDSSSDARSRMGEESDSLASSRPSLDNPSSDYHGSAEGSIYEGQVVPRVLRQDFDRSEVPTVYLDSRSHLSSTSSVSSLLQDADGPLVGHEAAFSRHLRHQARGDNSSISSGGAYSLHNVGLSSSSSPPPLSSSAESIATPTSSGNPSFADIPLGTVAGNDKDAQHVMSMHPTHDNRSGPVIVEATSMELRPQANKRPVISNPIPISSSVQFPLSYPRAPPSPATRRRSIPMLSLPSFSPTSPLPFPQSSPQSAGLGPEKGLRAKKPSLKLLFSKRSTSSLKSAKEHLSSSMSSFLSTPVLQTQGSREPSPKSGSDSSVSTPSSAVTAPQDSGSAGASSAQLPQFPPVLDTPIEDASLSLGFDISPPPTAKLGDEQAESMRRAEDEKSSSHTRARNSPYGSGNTPPTARPLQFNSKRTIKPGENHIRPQASSSNLSIVSSTSSHHLSLFEDDDTEDVEDWTQSVLLAADVDGKWPIQRLDAKP